MRKFLFIFSVIISLIQFSFAGDNDNDSELPEPPTIQPKQCSKKRAQETNKLPPAKKQKTDTLKTWIGNNFSEHGEMLKEFSELMLSIEHDKFQGRKTVSEIIRGMDEECHQNPILIAFMICLSELGIESSMVKKYIQVVRSGLRTTEELTSRTADDMHFTVMNAKNGGQLPSFFTHTFIGTMHAGLLDFIKKFSDDNDFNIFINKLYTKYKKTNPETIAKPFSFPEGAIVENSEHIDDNILQFIESLDAESDEKEALKSIFLIKIGGRKLVDKIRELKKSINTHPLIASLSVYLSHFGVASENIFFVILKIREEKDNDSSFGKTTPGKIYKNYHDIASNKKQPYFRRPFFMCMKEIFEPLLHEYMGQEARFSQSDHLERAYGVGQQSKPINLNYYDSYAEEARKLDGSLVDWIESNITRKSDQLAFFAMMTTKMSPLNQEEKSFADIIKEIPNVLNGNPHFCAGIIFLKHFGVSSVDIFNFIKEIRDNSLNTKKFGPLSSHTIYTNFLCKTKKLPNPLSSKSFNDTLNKILLPLMQKLSIDRDAQFLAP